MVLISIRVTREDTMTFTPMLWRSAVAKSLGLAIGLLAFFAIPSVLPGATLPFRLGIAALFLTLGGIVGLVGFIERIPLFGWKLSPLARGAAMGVWMGLLAALLAWDTLTALLAGLWGLPDWLTSPLWIMVDCGIAGALIDVFATAVIGRVSWPEAGLSDT
jgi:hypothetical protein